MTNFDWIKSMTKKQFAKWFCNNLDRAFVCGGQNQYYDTSEDNFIKWLEEQKRGKV